MTILGQHTVAETRDLMRATEFRVNKNIQQLQKVQSHRLQPITAEQKQLDNDVRKFVEHWVDVRDKQTLLMAAAVASNPNVNIAILPAEPNFVAIDNAARRDEPRLMDIQGRIEAEAAEQGLAHVDFSAQPTQDSPDADFAALKKLDAAIAKVGLPPAGKPTPIGYYIAGAAAAALGIVVVTKVYL